MILQIDKMFCLNIKIYNPMTIKNKKFNKYNFFELLIIYLILLLRLIIF